MGAGSDGSAVTEARCRFRLPTRNLHLRDRMGQDHRLGFLSPGRGQYLLGVTFHTRGFGVSSLGAISLHFFLIRASTGSQ